MTVAVEEHGSGAAAAAGRRRGWRVEARDAAEAAGRADVHVHRHAEQARVHRHLDAASPRGAGPAHLRAVARHTAAGGDVGQPKTKRQAADRRLGIFFQPVGQHSAQLDVGRARKK